MRLFALALTLSLADFAVASAQTATPDSENGRYSFNPVADGALRLDTRTGQVSQCSRRDVGIFDGHNDVLLRLYRRGDTVTERGSLWICPESYNRRRARLCNQVKVKQLSAGVIGQVFDSCSPHLDRGSRK